MRGRNVRLGEEVACKGVPHLELMTSALYLRWFIRFYSWKSKTDDISSVPHMNNSFFPENLKLMTSALYLIYKQFLFSSWKSQTDEISAVADMNNSFFCKYKSICRTASWVDQSVTASYDWCRHQYFWVFLRIILIFYPIIV